MEVVAHEGALRTEVANGNVRRPRLHGGVVGGGRGDALDRGDDLGHGIDMALREEDGAVRKQVGPRLDHAQHGLAFWLGGNCVFQVAPAQRRAAAIPVKRGVANDRLRRHLDVHHEDSRTRGSTNRYDATARLAIAPATCATMKAATSAGAMPANVSDRLRPTVTAGFANEVDAVNQ